MRAFLLDADGVAAALNYRLLRRLTSGGGIVAYPNVRHNEKALFTTPRTF